MLPKKLTVQPVCEPDFPIVGTKYGKLRGMMVEGTYIFRGVRYAKAERFHMPEEPDAWEGVKNSTAFGPVCRELSTLQPDDAFTVPHFWYPQSEDCHFLNIWTQSLDPNALRPVMVWIHGGGMHHGSGVEIYSYDGEELSQFGDVVVVSLNHRLNVLGYCDLSAYGEEYRYSGNLGTADLVAALKWVQENIRGFGGDPDRVMIFGQSGGGSKIISLMQSPHGDGLFHRACIESGARAKSADRLPEEARDIAAMILKAAGIKEDEAYKLEKLPFHKLALAVGAAGVEYKEKYGRRLNWAPTADGDYYLGHPGNVGFRKESLGVEMILGTVQGEFSNSTIDPEKHLYGPKAKWTSEVLERRLKKRFGDGAERMKELFMQAYPDKNPADVLYTDFISRTGHVDLAKMRAAVPGAASVYNYILALEMPADGGATAWHNAEEAFVFHNASCLESTYIPGVTDQLQDMMCGAWAAFAATGNPNHEGMPEWTPVKDDVTATMVFDRISGMKYGYDDELRALGAKLPQAQFDKGPKSGVGGGPRVEI